MSAKTNLTAFEEILNEFRVKLKALAKEVKEAKETKSKCEVNGTEDIGEEMANMMLAYRHLENASMRIGKTLQACSGGVSPYDNTAVGTPETQPDSEENSAN